MATIKDRETHLSTIADFLVDVEKWTSPRVILAPGSFDGPRIFQIGEAGAIHRLTLESSGFELEEALSTLSSEFKAKLLHALDVVPMSQREGIPIICDLSLDSKKVSGSYTVTLLGRIWSSHPALATASYPFGH